jgi:hypothetical protein
MFLPWRGLFEQAMLADVFIFHDNIALPRSHGKNKAFQTRVQIKTQSGWEWLTLPVAKSEGPNLLINEARFPNQDWRQNHLRMIRNAYQAAPFFDQIFEELVAPIYEYETELVAQFCAHGMLRLLAHLGVNVEVAWSSNLPIPADLAGSRRVLAHCLHFQADTYVTGLGAMKYIDYDLFETHGVRINYMRYALTPYPQLHGQFNSSVSIIDLLFNTGPACKTYLGSPAVYWRELDVETESRRVK